MDNITALLDFMLKLFTQ